MALSAAIGESLSEDVRKAVTVNRGLPDKEPMYDVVRTALASCISATLAEDPEALTAEELALISDGYDPEADEESAHYVAIRSAIEQIVANVDAELNNYGNHDEVEMFSAFIIPLLRRYGFSTYEVRSAISRRLAEIDESYEEDDYDGYIVEEEKVDEGTDRDIESLFSTLLD